MPINTLYVVLVNNEPIRMPYLEGTRVVLFSHPDIALQWAISQKLHGEVVECKPGVHDKFVPSVANIPF